MKKFLAILMALCLLGACALAEPAEVKWADVAESVAASGIEGDIYPISDLGVSMFIPTVLQEVELTEEDVQNGYLAYLATEDQSAAVAVMYANLEGASLEDYAAVLPEVGATEVEYCVINGIPAVSYEMPENDTVNVAMTTDTGYGIEFVFSPASDEGFKTIAAIMTASIQG